MPLRDAQRNALVEFVFVKALGRGVHHADQLVVVAVLFVEQRRGMLGIKTESRFECVLVVGKVIHLLRNFGMENLEAVGKCT